MSDVIWAAIIAGGVSLVGNVTTYLVATRQAKATGAAVRGEFRHLAAGAGVRRRFAPHQLRHAMRMRSHSPVRACR